ncbi:MAG: NADPH-dependent 7-cyano-7-deazaguanine reductase QueF [Candidatus Aureabacteria bacterium]|nr:NADPH-dependent 7-cyano-7-deazaguanine reductase QueF [Candidatus Auribacterota bacterium]
MAKAEGKTFSFESPKKIRTGFLETFPYKGGRQMVEYSTKEFSAVCPFSGLPDYGTLTVRYVPRRKCLELKSYKYYLVSFRNVGIYQEAATDRIFKDLKKALNPYYLFVETVYNTRGGIDSKCQMESGKRNV